MLCVWNQHALHRWNCRLLHKVKWFFFCCFCHLGNGIFSHIASSEKKWPNGDSPPACLRINSPSLGPWLVFLHKVSIPPSLLSPTNLKWPVSIWHWVSFLNSYLRHFKFSPLFLAMSKMPSFIFSIHLCKMRLQNRKSGQSPLVLFLVPLGLLASTLAGFQCGSRGGRHTRVRPSWEMSMRINQTTASQSCLSSRGKSGSLP